MPSLLNSPSGVRYIDGREVEPPHFNESLPQRNQPPLTEPVPGAMPIQRVIDRIAWAEQIVSPVAFAMLLRRTPPAGIPARPFIYQFARSDMNATNPASFDIVRAGDFADRVVLYRHDLNFGNEGVPPDSHAFMSSPNAPAHYSRVTLGAQQQIATFFASDGTSMIHPTPTELWEVPVRTPLPEDLFFLPRPR